MAGLPARGDRGARPCCNAGWLPALLATWLLAPAWAGDEASACLELRDTRDRLALQAMQAEIVLLQAVRQRLCPQQEAQAAAANALAAAAAQPAPLDYEAYIRCRERAEAQLRRSRPVLYTSLHAFPYYTPSGARLVRQADDLQRRFEAQCGPRRSTLR